MPTLLRFCGIPIPESVEGRDLGPLLRGEEPDGDDTALSMCIAPFAEYTGLPWRGVHTARYTYTRRLDGPWLLYDNESDPHQLTNLTDDPTHESLQAHSRKPARAPCSRNEVIRSNRHPTTSRNGISR